MYIRGTTSYDEWKLQAPPVHEEEEEPLICAMCRVNETKDPADVCAKCAETCTDKEFEDLMDTLDI